MSMACHKHTITITLTFPTKVDDITQLNCTTQTMHKYKQCTMINSEHTECTLAAMYTDRAVQWTYWILLMRENAKVTLNRLLFIGIKTRSKLRWINNREQVTRDAQQQFNYSIAHLHARWHIPKIGKQYINYTKITWEI